MVITAETGPALEPIEGVELAGKLDMYDAVGNKLFTGTMVFIKEQTRLVYLWDGANQLDRVFGGSAYLLVAKIDISPYGPKNIIKRNVVGVKK